MGVAFKVLAQICFYETFRFGTQRAEIKWADDDEEEL
jgi:hypothetical protein